MNKWRLLLFSVFTLLHITTSERNFIDGRYGSCNHSPRYSSSDTRISTYDNYRVNRYFPEIRQLKTPDKYRDSEERVPEIPKISRERQIEYRERRSRDYTLQDDNRRIVTRQRSRILQSTPIDIHGRQNYRERIDVRPNDLRTDIRLERFVRQYEREYENDGRTSFLSRNDNRQNRATMNRFESRDMNRYNHNDRDTRNIRDRRIESARYLLEGHKEIRYSNRNVNSNGFDNINDSEDMIFSPKAILIMRVDREQPKRKTRSDRIHVIEKLENDRNSRLRTRHGLLTHDIETRIDYASSYVRNQDIINFNRNKRSLVRDNQHNKHFRNFEDSNTLDENRQRSNERVVERRVINEIRNVARNHEFEALRKSSPQHKEYDHRFERDIRAHNDRRLSFDQNLEINRKRNNHERSVSAEVDILRSIRVESLISFASTYVRRQERLNYNENKLCLVQKNQLNRRIRNVEDSLTENRQRSTERDVESRAINEMRGDGRSYEFQAIRKSAPQQRQYTDNRIERHTRTQNDRSRSFERNLEMYSTRERSVSEEIDLVRVVRDEARLKLNRRNVRHTIRVDTERSERDTRERRSERISRIRDILLIDRERNFENINSSPYMERNKRVYAFESRSNNYRYSERGEIRNINQNERSLDTRDNLDRAYERANKRSDRAKRNSPAAEYTIRVELRRSYDNRRDVYDDLDRVTRRTRRAITVLQEIRERDVSRRNSRRLSRDVRSRERLGVDENTERQRYDVRRNSIKDDIVKDNRQERFVRQDQNRIQSNRNTVITRNRFIHARDNIESRSLTNEERLTIRRQHMRNTRFDARQNTRDRRTTVTVNDRDSYTMEFSDLERSISTQKIQFESDVFGIKWQYLFYALQAIYLCRLLMKIPNEDGKKKIRLNNWFAPTEYLKID